MVRNVTGGSKHKSQARKNVAPRGGASGALRVVQEEGECFAQVERMLGGSNCHVKCVDGVTRICVIRGKFRGKGKRDNVLSVGSIVLVGMRDYESCKSSDKLETCDLLEVYRETDKTRLFSSVKIDWSEIVTTPGCAGEKVAASACEEFSFMTDDQIELERLMKEQEENILARTKTNTVCADTLKINEMCAVFGDDDDDVDVDDV
jgi:initiation factor 1A